MVHIPAKEQASFFPEGLEAPGIIDGKVVTEVFQPISAQSYDPLKAKFCRTRPAHGQWVIIQTALDLRSRSVFLLHTAPHQKQLRRGDPTAPTQIEISGIEISAWQAVPSAFKVIKDNSYPTLTVDRIILVKNIGPANEQAVGPSAGGLRSGHRHPAPS